MINWKSISLKDLAGFISEKLREEEIEATLVGGACVTIYSKNRYQSYDLDFVTYEDMKKVKKVLLSLGLDEKSGYFQHKDCKWFIEFVSPPIAVGNEPIEILNEFSTPLGTIKMLTVHDSLKDRLASYYHWNDKQALEQALQICRENAIDIGKIEAWSKKENMLDKFQLFLTRLKDISK